MADSNFRGPINSMGALEVNAGTAREVIRDARELRNNAGKVCHRCRGNRLHRGNQGLHCRDHWRQVDRRWRTAANWNHRENLR